MCRHLHLQAGFKISCDWLCTATCSPGSRRGKQGRLCGLAAPCCQLAGVAGCAADCFWFCNDFSKISEWVRAVGIAEGE